MKIIEKIEIHRFRSISDASIKIDDLNIFSGKNNSGKSNILRALNLFFNGDSSFNQKYDFYKDYNQAFTGQAGGKRATKITLHFGKQGDAALGAPFSITRIFQFGRDVETIYHSTDENIQNKIKKNDGNINRQFTIFLNKIEYYYIPAVRDKKFVQNLLLLFEKLIEHDSGKDFAEKIGELSDILKIKSEDISADFEKFIGLPTRAALSSKASDLLGTIEINVKTGIEIVRRTKAEGKKKENVEVNLFSSGDGILMSYLAYFLAHICKKISNKIFIWGFEEPENSLEYSKVQTIAGEFYNDFRNNAQILITTHSPAFVNLKDKEKVCFYRVYIEPKDQKQSSKIKTLQEIKNRQQSLFESGLMENEEYKKLSEELHFVEFAQEIEGAVEKIYSEEKLLNESRVKFETKYSSLLQTHPSKVFVCEDSSKTTIKIWKRWLKMFNLNNVEVMSSNGCTTMNIEIWAHEQQKLDTNYKPKIFREIDRDGLTDKQIKLLIDKKFKNISGGLLYKVEFLPVHEVENFAVIKESKFDCKFWKDYGDDIKNLFEIKSSAQAKLLDKFFDYKEPAYHGSDGNYTSVMQDMRNYAIKDWKKFFKGKEICKKIPNFNPLNYLRSLNKNDLPKELIEYITEVKKFYET